MMSAMEGTVKVDIDSLDLEDKLNWVKEILENGREVIAEVQFGDKLKMFIEELVVSMFAFFLKNQESLESRSFKLHVLPTMYYSLLY